MKEVTEQEFHDWCKDLFAGLLRPNKLCIDLEYGDEVTIAKYMERRGYVEITPKKKDLN